MGINAIVHKNARSSTPNCYTWPGLFLAFTVAFFTVAALAQQTKVQVCLAIVGVLFFIFFAICVGKAFVEDLESSKNSVSICKSISAAPSSPTNNDVKSQDEIELPGNNLGKTHLEGGRSSSASGIDINQEQNNQQVLVPSTKIISAEINKQPLYLEGATCTTK